MYLIFDIGGSSTKIGLIKNNKIVKKYSVEKKETLEEFISFLEKEVTNVMKYYKIKGVGFSSPGTVNSNSGEILGLSAVEYINDYNFAKHIQDKYKLPVAIENDANCAALAQLYMDNPKEKDIAFVIIGTGIGGAIIKDGKLIKGRRLEAGEFGYMLLKNDNGEYTNYSRLATLPNTMTRLREKYNIEDNVLIALNKYFDKIDPYYTEIKKMFEYLCMGLYNIQYIYDPQVIYIGGGISQSKLYMDELKRLIKKDIFSDADIEIRAVTYYNDNNIYGAYANLINSIKEGRLLCIR